MKHCCVDNITVRGYSHILNNRECQDNSVAWDGGDYCAVIVCDGHGGEKYIRSRYGSAFACAKGRQCIEKFMRSPDVSDKGLRQLELSIIQAWNSEVEDHLSCYPLDGDEHWAELKGEDKSALIKSPTKAYGTTFIAAVYKKGKCFVLKLGDGNVNILYDDGSVEAPQELVDEQLQFNVTTSLCSSRADLEFTHCIKCGTPENPLVGVILTTDGVINCYSSEQAYLAFIKNVESGYLDDPKEQAHAELEDCLHLLSQKGSGDDLSIAIIREQKKSQNRESGEQFVRSRKEIDVQKEPPEEQPEFDDLRFYYSQLTDSQKYVYDRIYDAIAAYMQSVIIRKDMMHDVEFGDVLRAISLDNPQVFYVDFCKWTWQEGLTRIRFIPTYYYKPDDIRARKARADEYVEKIVGRIRGASDYEKELALHDLLAEQVCYDNEALSNLQRYLPRSNTVLGVLFCKTAVCEGIAKTAKMVFDKLGIKSIVVEGKTDDSDNFHAWNIVQIDGKLYHLDITWDINLSCGNKISHSYFNLTDGMMSADHKWGAEYPRCG